MREQTPLPVALTGESQIPQAGLKERLKARRLLDRALTSSIILPLSVVEDEYAYLFKIVTQNPLQQLVLVSRHEGVSSPEVRSELNLSRRQTIKFYTEGVSLINQFLAQHGIDRTSLYGRALKDAATEGRLDAIKLFDTYYSLKRDIDNYKGRMREIDRSQLAPDVIPLADFVDPTSPEYHRLIHAKIAQKEGPRWVVKESDVTVFQNQRNKIVIPDNFVSIDSLPISESLRNHIYYLQRTKQIEVLKKNRRIFIEKEVAEAIMSKNK